MNLAKELQLIDSEMSSKLKTFNFFERSSFSSFSAVVDEKHFIFNLENFR